MAGVPNTPETKKGGVLLLGLGAVILIGVAVAAFLSHSFPYGTRPIESPLPAYTAIAVGLGLLFWIASTQVGKVLPSETFIWSAIFIGLAMRAMMFVSLPVLEDDSYRYFWDGAAVAQGVNPYKFAPIEADERDAFGEPRAVSDQEDLAALQTLARARSREHHRINYPYVTTIYPPITQVGFAAAHFLEPFGLNGWRFVLLIVDLLSLVLLLRTLSAFGRSPLWAILYWWNPVVVLQGFGAAHMDILVVPFLIGALYLHKKNRLWGSVAALAGAAAVKLWPILLFPAVARKSLRQPLRFVGLGIFFVGLTGALLSPQILSAISTDSGLFAYASSWRRHAFLFGVLEDGVFSGFYDPAQMSRLFVAGAVSSIALWFAYFKAEESDRLPAVLMIITVALILMSPTGYPWYLIWIAPFLAFVPNTGVVALVATAPIYYVRFLMGDQDPLYLWGVVPFAYAIPIVLMIISIRSRGADA